MSRIAPGRLAIKVAVGLAAAGLLPAGGDAQAVGATEARAASEIRVMTFNIRYGTAEDGENAWPNRRSLVFEAIRDFRPDVLGVQEALDFQLEELRAALPGVEIVGVGRDDGVRAGEFSAILVDGSRLEVLDHGTFWFSDTPASPGSVSWGNRIPRICTWARVRDRTTDGRFIVYNVHWDHESQPSRERSADLLVDRITGRAHGDEPVLVMGDFNAGESNPAFLTLVEAGVTGLRDTFRALHPDASDVGTFNGFEGRRDGEKIDAILASDGWCPRSAAIVGSAQDGRYPSDHFPVTAVLSPGSDGCSPPAVGA
jgi:endonuclease/exonuclease/phosphatase family metal-dependent hydrolase